MMSKLLKYDLRANMKIFILIWPAMLLFAGYVEQATEFAKGHGGGGGGPSSGWGRDPKDDDREWARRCAMMATKMMRSGSGRKLRR